ncbi:acetyl-CoA carboxylase carboxyltransferase subunit alpha [Gammaproteobacteria bacterium]|nr:acetyl-CoA carboxylase carboxyltransferase subunit alpha [Gammaproteobacteria bacterium]
MPKNFLDFEKPIQELQMRIDGLRLTSDGDDGMDISDDVERLERKAEKLRAQIYSTLNPWQVTQVARHPDRPYTLDYVDMIFEDFDELHGDRMFADDGAIVGGLARIDGRDVMLIGHHKGRKTDEKIRRNFGMPRPEGYRKAQRLMKLAEKFSLPLVTLIDTPGAYPGVDAEARGQSEAIARSLYVMAGLKTPILSIIVGEGGSGGALAIGVCDRLLMLQYSIYSVISPEGCASILWKDSSKAPTAAEAMGLTTDRLLELGLIDGIISEPIGGAHKYPTQAAESLRQHISSALDELTAMEQPALMQHRQQRLASYGRYG